MPNLKALVPSSAKAEVAPLERSVTRVNVRELHAGIQAGIRKLLTAFPAGAPQQLDDRTLMARIYAEACEGFEECVVAYVLRRMPFHNPRNPFPPTAQDIRERCKLTSERWKRWSGRYRWAQICEGDDLSPYDDKWGWSNGRGRIDDGWNSDWGPPPDKPGCYVPSDMITAGMQDCFSAFHDRIIKLPEETFALIPHVAFPPGLMEEVKGQRKQRFYEKGLSTDEWDARQRVLNECRWNGKPAPEEPEIRRLTGEVIKQREADAAWRLEKFGVEVACPAPQFAAGERVWHRRFGWGSISDTQDGGVVTVAFEDASRKIHCSFLFPEEIEPAGEK